MVPPGSRSTGASTGRVLCDPNPAVGDTPQHRIDCALGDAGLYTLTPNSTYGDRTPVRLR